MKAVFLHQNCPGQFKHLAPAMAKRGDQVTFLSRPGRPDLPGVRRIEYSPHRTITETIHPYLASSEAAVLQGQGVARVLGAMKQNGETPDIVVGNPGWGETLFVKDIWPDVPLLLMVEFFYRGQGSDVGFDPEFSSGPDAPLRARTRSGPHLLAIDAADAAYAPTNWQREQFPAAYRDKIDVIHDGIDCTAVLPNPTVQLTLPNGRILTRSDEVLTYVARNLEPYRGFHSFMRALPEVLRRRPEAQVVIVGDNGVSYGAKPKDGRSWRDVLVDEIGGVPERVHFVGSLPYADYLKVLQVSSVHAYFTYPFVLSWSMLEAMAAGACVVGSATPPVEEVINNGQNGHLVDFFDTTAIAETLAENLERRNQQDTLRTAARDTIVSRYALPDMLVKQLALVDELVGSTQ